MKYIKMFFISFFTVFLWPIAVLAEQTNNAIKKLNEIGSQEGPYQLGNEYSLSDTVGVVIQAVLAIIGVVFLVLMLYAGFNWMIARGEEEKVEKAKDTITRAIIGIIIVTGAYAIWAFVFQYLF